MGFEDFFENNRNHHGNYGKQSSPNHYNDSHDSHRSYHGEENHVNWAKILMKIRSNKKLKWFIIIAAILILVVAIGLVVALLPLLGKIFTYISQLDLKGLQDFITGLVEKILKGSAG